MKLRISTKVKGLETGHQAVWLLGVQVRGLYWENWTHEMSFCSKKKKIRG